MATPAITAEAGKMAERIARSTGALASVVLVLDPDPHIDRIHIGAHCPDVETLRLLLEKTIPNARCRRGASHRQAQGVGPGHRLKQPPVSVITGGMDDAQKPIDWKRLEQLAALWARTRVFPELAAQDYWERAGLDRGVWQPGNNAWRDRKGK